MYALQHTLMILFAFVRTLLLLGVATRIRGIVDMYGNKRMMKHLAYLLLFTTLFMLFF